jgi:flagellum-specific peptidoglycan hydrolase FlgJ
MVSKLLFLFAIVPTKQQVWNKINELGIKHPKVVFAQAVHESAAFKSTLAKTCNNLFGMRVPKKRTTLAQKGCKYKHGFAKYVNWEQSIEDYKLYQDYVLRKKENMSDDGYLSYISKKYAADPNYVAHIKRTINQNSKLW